jgi:TRAP-type transport system small permease protein
MKQETGPNANKIVDDTTPPVPDMATDPRWQRLSHGLDQVLGWAAGSVLFLMMFITTLDVLGRSLLNKPLPGGVEITEMMLAALIFCALPLVSKSREHIVIDTFDFAMSKRFKRACDVLADIVSGFIMCGVGYLIVRRALRIMEDRDYTSVLHIPYAPVAWLIVVMVIITAGVHFALVFVPHPENEEGARVV